ncbi:MAG: cysteine desulfurase family protein, partial [Pirellulaceae bacterium]|nr:cysteine desulfurase family protein [Pirellulaceae bacterium]
NLALRGATDRARRRGNHIVSVATEHKAVLDPLTRLGRRDFEVTLLAVEPNDGGRGGWLDPQRVRDAIRDDTMLVSVMLANNEIGVLQSLAEIAAEIRGSDILLHTDATQAIGKIAVDVERLGVDLMSFSAHKLYGPKGVGGLFVSRQKQAGRLQPQIDGGGQEGGVRSGTINVPGVVGFARAVELAEEERTVESQRVGGLRDRLFDALRERVADVQLNGPALSAELRLAGNLNCSFPLVDGEALMMSMREICVSSGSACTSANPEPSHVLRALGLSEDMTRASLRFGVGRFNTAAEIDFAADRVGDAVARLRKMSSLS